MAIQITRRFAVDVAALLFPRTRVAIPRVNTNVTGVISIVVVIWRSNSNCSAVSRKRDALATPISRRFPVDIAALLFPRARVAIPRVNTNVTRVPAIVIVKWRSNSNCSAVCGE